MSVYVTAYLIRTSLSANSVTVASILVGLGGTGLFLGDEGTRVAGVALLYVSFLLDQVDGEVARYRNATSLTGSFLDEIRHILIYAAPVYAVGLRLVMDGAHPLIAGAGFSAAICLAIVRFSRNAKYLLVAKKLLASVNGPIQSSTRRQSPLSAVPAVHSRLGRLLRYVFGWLLYVTTNQVSLLLLLMLFQVASYRIGWQEMVQWYVGYSVLVTVVTAIDVYEISWVRLERWCAELISRIDPERA